MNIKEVYKTLVRVAPDLILKRYDYVNNPSYDHIFFNLEEYSSAFKYVDLVSPFLIDKQTRDTLAPILSSKSTQFPSLKKDAEKIIEASDDLFLKVTDYIAYLVPLVDEEENENSIDVKLIHIKTLDDLEKAASLLKRGLNMPALEIGGQVTVGKVESGSLWLELITENGVAVTGSVVALCGNIIWAALAITNKIREGKRHEEFLRTIKVKNDFTEGISEHLLQYYKRILDAEAQHIINKYMDGKDNPELHGQIKGSIEAIGDLIEKGAEFYPSLKAPEETKALFPNFNVKELVESQTKLLSEGKDDSENKD